MKEKRCRLFRASLVLSFCFGILLAPIPASYSSEIQISPHKIVLNAVGQSDGIQAIISMYLPSSWFDSFSIELRFNGIKVAEAESVRYCLIDQNLLVSFDRTDLQENQDVQSFAGQTVTAEVEGWVTVSSSDGSLYLREFEGTAQVEIVAPGKRK